MHPNGEEQGDVWDKEYRRVGAEVKIKEYRYKLVRDTEPA